MYLTESIEEQGILDELQLKSAVCGAEPWTEEMRNQIESRLHIKAHDIYGLSEIMGPGVAGDCVYHKGLHINEDHFLPEIISADTLTPIGDGEIGELVFTTLTKEALPLIRYRTRDLCKLTREKSACGRTHVRMNKPMGRSDDMMVVKGVNVWPSQIEQVLLQLGYQANYRIVVDRENNRDSIEVQVEKTPAMAADETYDVTKAQGKIVAGLKNMLGIKVDVQVVEPMTIERSEGKAKRVIDRRNLYRS
jgi:phenylacetate-CoA ligase